MEAAGVGDQLFENRHQLLGLGPTGPNGVVHAFDCYSKVVGMVALTAAYNVFAELRAHPTGTAVKPEGRIDKRLLD
jgi:hypothetical protein